MTLTVADIESAHYYWLSMLYGERITTHLVWVLTVERNGKGVPTSFTGRSFPFSYVEFDAADIIRVRSLHDGLLESDINPRRFDEPRHIINPEPSYDSIADSDPEVPF
jgi:hypothetical protein